MEKDNQIIPSGSQTPQVVTPGQPTPLEFKQEGSGNTQIGHVEHYDGTVNQTVVILNGFQTNNRPVAAQSVKFNYDCFNLFVLGDEKYDQPTFIVPKNRALTECTSDEMKEQCASLTPEAVRVIKTFPALFCSENHNFTKTDPDHMAYYGYVNDVKVQDNGIKVYFQILNSFPQQILIDMAEDCSNF